MQTSKGHCFWDIRRRRRPPQRILHWCSLLPESPTDPRFNAIGHIFNRLITFFPYGWINIGVTRALLIADFLFYLHLAEIVFKLYDNFPVRCWVIINISNIGASASVGVWTCFTLHPYIGQQISTSCVLDTATTFLFELDEQKGDWKHFHQHFSLV